MEESIIVKERDTTSVILKRKAGGTSSGLMNIHNKERYYWFHLFLEVKELREYDSLITEWNHSFLQESSKPLTQENTNKLDSILIRWWRRINSDMCSNLLNKIHDRKTKGQLFQELIEKIEQIQSKSEKEKTLEDQKSNYSKLKKIDVHIDERLESERHQKYLFWFGIFLSCFLGSLLGFFVGVILFELGFA